MATVLAKVRSTQKKPPATRMCLHCHCVRNLSEFYSNRDWVDQAGKDIWCKKCISQIQTKDEMREYFFENHRKWNERIWDNAQKKAEMQAAKNTVYQKSNEERREIILEALTCQMVPSIMQIHYAYIDNSQDINANSYQEAKEAGKIVELEKARKVDSKTKTYNSFFNGDFTGAELEYLMNFYEGLNKDFNLDEADTALQDNAKKLAKSALTADKVQNDYLAGRCSMQDVTNAMTAYNSLLTISNFAANKRKPGEKSGLSSWAETTAYLETHGHPCIKKIDWPKDVVDAALEGLGYIVISMREDRESDPE